jgi:UDP-glucose 4-epimerase
LINTIITGSSGLVGKAIFTLLTQKGISTTGISSRLHSKNILQLDLQTQKIEQFCNLNLVNVIIHCAAIIPNSINSMSSCKLVNELIDTNIFETVKAFPHIKLIFISTTNFYNFDTNIITENSEINCKNEYALAKYNSEKKFSTLENNIVIFRINAPYHPSMKVQTVLSTFMQKALANENFYYSGSGARSQDFTHTNDIAQAIYEAIMLQEIKGIYNIASGYAISMQNLALQIVAAIPDCKSIVQSTDVQDPQENYRANFDITKAKTELHWQPQINIQQGIQQWINFSKA